MARFSEARKVSRVGSNRLFTYLAVGLGLLAAVLVFVALRGEGTGGAPSGGAVVPVVVAARDIPARTALTADMLRLEQVPSRSVVADAYRERDALVGEVTRYPIAAREQIGAQKIAAASALSTKTGDKDAADGLSFVVPPGKRGVSISITEPSAIGGLIIAGDHVDVIALFDKELAGIEKAVTALQNVEVLSVAQATQAIVPPAATATPAAGTTAATADARGTRPVEAKAQPQARTVTLALTPGQAALVALAEQHGKLWLSLRAYEDDATVDVPHTDLLSLGVLSPDRRPR